MEDFEIESLDRFKRSYSEIQSSSNLTSHRAISFRTGPESLVCQSYVRTLPRLKRSLTCLALTTDETGARGGGGDHHKFPRL